MGTRKSRSFRASVTEMGEIERAAFVIGLEPATLVRNAALATARRVLGAAEAADPEVTRAGNEGRVRGTDAGGAFK